MSFAARFNVITAKLAPPELPTKNVEAVEGPPLTGGLTTVTLAVPIAPISAPVMAACNSVLETKVVVRGLPFH